MELARLAELTLIFGHGDDHRVFIGEPEALGLEAGSRQNDKDNEESAGHARLQVRGGGTGLQVNVRNRQIFWVGVEYKETQGE